MTSQELPPFAAWRHRDGRDGFEVVFLHTTTDRHRVEGHTTAIEGGQAWAVHYSIVVDGDWATQTAHVVARSSLGRRELRLEADGNGAWLVDDHPAPQLAGCLDVDLESSAFTNALPVHRLRLRDGQRADAPAVYVRALDLVVERLEQSYLRTGSEGENERYDYSAPRFDYSGQLVYDSFGLLLDYPGIAERVA